MLRDPRPWPTHCGVCNWFPNRSGMFLVFINAHKRCTLFALVDALTFPTFLSFACLSKRMIFTSCYLIVFFLHRDAFTELECDSLFTSVYDLARHTPECFDILDVIESYIDTLNPCTCLLLYYVIGVVCSIASVV